MLKFVILLNSFWFVGFDLLWASNTLTVASQSKMEFKAKITFSSFTGSSNKIEGYVNLDSKQEKIIEAEISIPVDSIQTGLSKRDQHMKQRYLEINKHPKIYFRIQKAQPFVSNATNKIEGQWDIHGVKKTQTLEFIIKETKEKPNYYTVNSEFELDISDYKIKQPKYMLLKMENLLKMRLNLFFINKSP